MRRAGLRSVLVLAIASTVVAWAEEPDIAGLCQQLKDARDPVRLAAARALRAAAPKDAIAVEALTAALKDSNSDVRRQSVLGLEKIGAPAQGAVPALIELIKDKETAVRTAAITALGVLAPPSKDAVPALAEALGDPVVGIRIAAIEALKKHGPAADEAKSALLTIATTEKNTDLVNPAIHILAALNPPPPEAALIFASAMSNSNLRAKACEGLEKLPAQAVAAASPLVSHESPDVRQEAIKLLGKLLPSQPGAASALVVAAHEKDANSRRAAVQALAKSPPYSPETLAALIAALDDTAPDIRVNTAIALVALENKNADVVCALVKMRMKHVFDNPLRKDLDAAILKLPKDSTRPALPEFIEGLKHKDWEIRTWSCKNIEALGAAASEAIPGLLVLLQDKERYLRAASGDALGALGSPAVNELVHYMRFERPDVRAAAAHALLRAGEPGMQWMKRLLLSDPNPDTRTSAAEAYAELAPASKEVIPLLVSALENRSNKVRYAVSNSLAKFGPEAIPELLTVISSGASDPRPLVDSLGRAGPAALPQLLEALNTGNLPVVLAVAEALPHLGTNVVGAVGPLAASVTRLAPEGEDWQKLCQRITQTLGSIGPDAKECIPFLVILMENKNRSVSASAATCFGKVAAGMEKLPPLSVAIENGDVDAIGLALGKLGAPGMTALIDALGDDKPAVRQRAATTSFCLGITSIPALQTALKSERWQLRAGALLAFFEFTHPRAVPKTRAAVLPAIPDIQAAIKDPHADVCILAAIAARKDAEAGENIPRVAKAMVDCNPDLRVKAAQMLANWPLDKHPDEMAAAAPHLLTAFKQDERRELRVVLRTVIPHVKTFPKESLALLAATMKEDFAPIRNAAIRAIEGYGAEAAEAVPVLVGYLGDPDRALGKNVNPILISIGQPAVPALLQAMVSEDSKARQLAAAALTKIKPSPVEAVPALIAAMKHASPETRLAAMNLIIPMGPAAKDAAAQLVAAMHDEDKPVRNAATNALLAIGSEAVPALLQGAKSEDSKQCVAALTMLAKMKPASDNVLPVLKPLLESKDVEVRRASIAVVGAIGPSVPQLIPFLVQTLNDDDKEISNAAADALGNIGAAALPALLAGTSDGNLNLRVRCFRALRGFAAEPPDDVVTKLISAIRDESPEVRDAAVQTLRLYKASAPKVLPEMILLLKDADYTIRRSAIMYMTEYGKLAPNDVVPPLAERLKDEIAANRRCAAEALKTMGPEAKIAGPMIIDALKDPDPRVRKAVIGALNDLGLANDEGARQGLNEMAIVDFIDQYSAMQERFRLKDMDGDGVLEYAQTFKEFEKFEPEWVAAEGEPGGTASFSGYRFKLLKAQADKAAAGRREYFINGNMTAGFAFVAYPAGYGKTGRYTFIATDDGAIYQKDLGAETQSLVAKLDVFDAAAWARVKEPLDLAPKAQRYNPVQPPIQPNIEF